MNGAELIKAVSDETGFTRASVAQVLTAAVDTIKAQILAGPRVTIFGLGTFSLVRRAPQTCHLGGKVSLISAHGMIKFKPAKELKEAAAVLG